MTSLNGIIKSHETSAEKMTSSLENSSFQFVSDMSAGIANPPLPLISNQSDWSFTRKNIETSVDQIIPYEQTESPLTITATGPSDLNNVTLYYRNNTNNGITWSVSDNHHDNDGTFTSIAYLNKAIIMNAYPYHSITPTNSIFAYTVSCHDNCLTIINVTKQWQQTEVAHYHIEGAPHGIKVLDYPSIGRVAFVINYYGGLLSAINVTNPASMSKLDSIDNCLMYGMYLGIDETNKILYITEYGVGDATDYLHAYNITNPSDIKWICKAIVPRDKPWTPHVNVNNLDYVYVSGDGGSTPYNTSVNIFNVTWVRNVTNPSMVYMKTQGYGAYADLRQDGNYLYGDAQYTYSGFSGEPKTFTLHVWDISDPTNLTNVSITALNTYNHFCLWTSANGHDFAFTRHYDAVIGDYGVNIVDLSDKSKPVNIGYVPNIDGTQDLYRCHWMQVHHNNITNTDVLYVIGYMDNSWVTFNLSYNYSNGGWCQWEDASNPDTSNPWSWNFDFPNGTGYYEFYSIGKKAGSSDEEAPASRDALCRYICGSSPPYKPHDPSPADGITSVDINTSFKWTGGDPDVGDTVTYDVYFGTTSIPLKVSSNQSATTYDPGTMNYNVHYYWMIVAWDNHGAFTLGPLWNFMTEPKIPPHANDDYVLVSEDSTNNQIDVLVNDKDPNNDSLVIISITKPSHGSSSFNAMYVFYTPTPLYHDSDSFNYTIGDGHGGTDSATVFIKVMHVNHPPLAIDDNTAILMEISNNRIDVLANDYDIDGDTLVITGASSPRWGTIMQDGQYVYYTANLGVYGYDLFTYTISDGHGGSDVATVIVMIQLNEPPAKPQRPSGSTQGEVGVEYTYTTTTSDPNNHQLYYQWDWGDGRQSNWLGSYNSSVTISTIHKWTVKGSYSIKVKAKDILGLESNWSDPLAITMPFDIESGSSLLLKQVHQSPNASKLLKQQHS